MKCTATAKSGQRCRHYVMVGEDKCIVHSDSERAREARKRGKILTKKDMIMELQRQLKKVKRSDADTLEKSREIRMILAQISELKGEKPQEEEEPKSGETFEKRVEKCMEEKEKQTS